MRSRPQWSWMHVIGRGLALAILVGSPVRAQDRTPAIVPSERAPNPAAALRVPLVVTAASDYSTGHTVGDVRIEVAISTHADPFGGIVIASGVADEQGLARFELPWEPILDARLAPPVTRLVVRVGGKGWQRAYRSTWLPLAEDPIEMRLIARPGVTVRGQLLDVDGRGVPGSVMAQDEGLTASRAGRITSRTSSEGRFVLQLPNAGTFEFLGEAVDGGTAMSSEVVVDDADPPQSIELRLRGAGRIRGTVRDDAGAPAAGVRVLVIAARIDRDVEQPSTYEPRQDPLHREGRGSVAEERYTAIDGTFDVRGLWMGDYVVRLHSSERSDSRASDGRARAWTRLAGVRASDGVPLDLTLTRPHLVVRVVDEQGALVRRHLDPTEKAPRQEVAAWPKSPVVLVRSALPVTTIRGLEAELRGLLLDTGEWIYEVDEDRDYFVQALGGQRAWAARNLRVPLGASRVVVDLVRAAIAPGHVRAAVLDPGGTPIVGGIAIEIQDVETGIVVSRIEPEYEREGVSELVAPVGTWRVVVEGRAPIGRQHGELLTARRFGSAEQIVRVESGRETSTMVTLAFGAKLRIHLVGSANGDDMTAVVADSGGDPLNLDSNREKHSRIAFVILRAEARPVVEVFFRRMDSNARWQVPTLTRWLELGDTATSEVLPAGDFDVEARLPGGRVVKRRVSLVEGGTTDVTIEF